MSKIEWTEQTWNPVVGCSLASPGCARCYAMRQAYRNKLMAPDPAASHYFGTTKVVNGTPIWTGKLAMAPDRIVSAPLRRRKATTWFVNSMGDLFHEDVPDEWIDRVFAIMALTPQHTYQVLTKRAERMRAYLTQADRAEAISCAEVFTAADYDRMPGGYGNAPVEPTMPTKWRRDEARGGDVCEVSPWPLRHVWLGCSAEDQQRADERIPHLLATPAAVRFVSCEPLLGPINLTHMDVDGRCGSAAPDGFYQINALTGRNTDMGRPCPEVPRLDWVIAGGESGPRARPMHPDWARGLRDQCAAAGVPFFFKQWGEHAVVYDRGVDDPDWRRCDEVLRKTPRGRWLNLAGGHGFHGKRVVRVDRVGKARAGALLDGREHREWPEVQP